MHSACRRCERCSTRTLPHAPQRPRSTTDENAPNPLAYWPSLELRPAHCPRPDKEAGHSAYPTGSDRSHGSRAGDRGAASGAQGRVEGHIRVPVFLPPSKETTFIVVLSRARALVFIGSLSERRTTCAAAAQGLERVSLRSGGALCSSGKLRMPEDSTRRARRGIHLRADIGVPQVRDPGLPPLLRAPHSCQRGESCMYP